MRMRPRLSPPASTPRSASRPALRANGSVHELTTAEKLMPGKCVECHADEAKALESSIHGQAARTATRTLPNARPATAPSTSVKDEGDSTAANARKNHGR